MSRLLGFALLCFVAAAGADENPRRALFHYQLYCQGCHTPDGSGAGAVPRMKDHIGTFLQTVKGREYLVRVPGSATSPLSDAHLAEVLNWIVQTMGGASVPLDAAPYTAGEVGRLRTAPLNEVVAYRKSLLDEVASLARKRDQ